MKAEMLGDVRRYDPSSPSHPVTWAWDATQSKVAPPPISQSQQIFVLIYSSIDKLGLFRFFTFFVCKKKDVKIITNPRFRFREAAKKSS